MITVKQYAEMRDISVQAVYQAMKRPKNKVLLDGHIKKEAGSTWLDDEAVRILDEGRNQQTIMVVPPDMEFEIEKIKVQAEEKINRMQLVITDLQTEKDELKDEVIKLNSELKEVYKEASERSEKQIESERKLREHYEEEIKRLNAALIEEKNKSWWDKLRGKI